MREFYEYLQSLGIIDPPDTIEIIQKLSVKKVIETSIKCYELTEGPVDKCCKSLIISTKEINDSSIFNFSVNTSVSGGVYPCSCIDCRIENVHDLETFAALYANRVLIPNPFEHIYHNILSNFNFKNNDQWNFFVNRLIGDIAVMINLKPLIDNGLLIINPKRKAYCKEHLKQQYALEKKIHSVFKKIQKKAVNDLNKNVQFILDKENTVILKGDENYIKQKILKFILLPERLKPYLKSIPHTLKPVEVEKMGLAGTIIDPIFEDLISQKYLTLDLDVSYLTNQIIETNIIGYLEEETDEKSREKALFDGLVHQLPFIENTSLNKLIKLREQESEAFILYRDSIKKTIGEMQNETNTKIVKKMVEEIINPQLNKLDRAIQNHRNDLIIKGGKKIIFDSIVFTAGHFISQIPNFICQNSIGDIFKNIFNILKYSRKAPIPEKVKNSSYYFLWKLKK